MSAFAGGVHITLSAKLQQWRDDCQTARQVWNETKRSIEADMPALRGRSGGGGGGGGGGGYADYSGGGGAPASHGGKSSWAATAGAPGAVPASHPDAERIQAMINNPVLRASAKVGMGAAESLSQKLNLPASAIQGALLGNGAELRTLLGQNQPRIAAGDPANNGRVIHPRSAPANQPASNAAAYASYLFPASEDEQRNLRRASGQAETGSEAAARAGRRVAPGQLLPRSKNDYAAAMGDRIERMFLADAEDYEKEKEKAATKLEQDAKKPSANKSVWSQRIMRGIRTMIGVYVVDAIASISDADLSGASNLRLAGNDPTGQAAAQMGRMKSIVTSVPLVGGLAWKVGNVASAMMGLGTEHEFMEGLERNNRQADYGQTVVGASRGMQSTRAQSAATGYGSLRVSRAMQEINMLRIQQGGALNERRNAARAQLESSLLPDLDRGTNNYWDLTSSERTVTGNLDMLDIANQRNVAFDRAKAARAATNAAKRSEWQKTYDLQGAKEEAARVELEKAARRDANFENAILNAGVNEQQFQNMYKPYAGRVAGIADRFQAVADRMKQQAKDKAVQPEDVTNFRLSASAAMTDAASVKREIRDYMIHGNTVAFDPTRMSPERFLDTRIEDPMTALAGADKAIAAIDRLTNAILDSMRPGGGK